MARSEGSVMLVSILGGQNQAEVARRAGATRQAVSAWASGQKKPTDSRRAVLEEAYGIPPPAWDRPPSGGEVSHSSGSSEAIPPRTAPQTAYDRALTHLADVDAQIADAKASGASHTEIARLFSCRSGALTALARCQPAWSTILESAEWQDILTRLRNALAPHREAAAAVAREFAEFGLDP